MKANQRELMTAPVKCPDRWISQENLSIYLGFFEFVHNAKSAVSRTYVRKKLFNRNQQRILPPASVIMTCLP
jgi:hypothetical protein